MFAPSSSRTCDRNHKRQDDHISAFAFTVCALASTVAARPSEGIITAQWSAVKPFSSVSSMSAPRSRRRCAEEHRQRTSSRMLLSAPSPGLLLPVRLPHEVVSLRRPEPYGSRSCARAATASAAFVAALGLRLFVSPVRRCRRFSWRLCCASDCPQRSLPLTAGHLRATTSSTEGRDGLTDTTMTSESRAWKKETEPSAKNSAFHVSASADARDTVRAKLRFTGSNAKFK